MTTADTATYHVRYTDGTYGEAIAFDTLDAEDQLEDGVEMQHGAVKGRAPAGATVRISTFGSER